MKSKAVGTLSWGLLPALLLLTGGCAPQAAPPPVAQPGADTPKSTISVVVSGVQSHDGKVLLALFASKDGFPGKRDKSMKRLETAITGDVVIFTVNDVPVGRYAISVLHDANDNDKMETDFFGRPKEGYGFSQNARGTFGPPGFDDAAFDLTSEPVSIQIDLIYD